MKAPQQEPGMHQTAHQGCPAVKPRRTEGLQIDKNNVQKWYLQGTTLCQRGTPLYLNDSWRMQTVSGKKLQTL